jgi:CheY-like chemotaxis protein
MQNDDKRSPVVLIVDDDYYFSTDVLGYHLKRRGYKVLHAYTVKEFEAQWKQADVIVLDIRLPAEEGYAIDPWGGLNALSRILAKFAKDPPPQLGNCIIRSAQTEEDAIGAGVPVPPKKYIWFAPDAPFSDVFTAIKKVAGGVHRAA